MVVQRSNRNRDGVGLFVVNLCVSLQYLLYFAIMVDYLNFKATASAV